MVGFILEPAHHFTYMACFSIYPKDDSNPAWVPMEAAAARFVAGIIILLSGRWMAVSVFGHGMGSACLLYLPTSTTRQLRGQGVVIPATTWIRQLMLLKSRWEDLI